MYAPPDPVYGLPVCTCTRCGVSVVRRAHRLRTHPIAFRRLDRAFNRMALTLFVIVCIAGGAMVMAALMARQAEIHDRSPWPALIHALRNAKESELLSIGVLLTILALVQLLSGLVLNRLLWHWKPIHLAIAWGLVLLALCALFPVFIRHDDGGPYTFHYSTPTFVAMVQIAVVCWLLTSVGLFVGRLTTPKREVILARRYRRSLRWARKRLARRRNG